MKTLLTRDNFREGIFQRDNFKCVICGNPAVDVHHIIERRLWSDEGYYFENGASLCKEHHIAAEQTTLSCDEIRNAAGITKVILPEHMYDDNTYDKWGNIILPDGRRTKGELFEDESVQKILAQGGVLDQFTNLVKYPRTYHLPWSPGLMNDDRMMPNVQNFENKEVVAMVKLDGENSSLYRDHFHVRSLDSRTHPSQTYIKNFHASIAHEIPEGWRFSCENMFAKHAIHYKNLKSYIYLFAIWNENNECLAWNDVEDWAKLLEIQTPKILYRGLWDEEKMRNLYTPIIDEDECEGFVVRLTSKFHYKHFKNCVAKYVRKGHVLVHGGHWRQGKITPNELVKV